MINKDPSLMVALGLQNTVFEIFPWFYSWNQNYSADVSRLYVIPKLLTQISIWRSRKVFDDSICVSARAVAVEVATGGDL